MTLATVPIASHAERRIFPLTRSGLAATLGAFVVVALLIGLPSVSATGAHASGALPATSAPVRAPTHSAAISGPFNPFCYPIDLGVCISIATPGETNIVPPAGTFVSSVEPNATSDLPLIIKSRQRLDWPGAAGSGQKSPILLNVSGNLWNGDPYYSLQQGDYWHSDTPTKVWQGPTFTSSNVSGYVYWYNVTINAKASNGAKNFFPGMTVTWWIELTYNVSYTYVHHESPHFVYTYSGAWPYSPYPGSNQYAGSSSTFQDIALTVTPPAPNWNDSVSLILNTTQADAVSNATIGSAYVDLWEASANGSPVQNGTLTFPVTSSDNGFGATSTTVVVPVSYAQLPTAVVTFRITVADMAGDQLVTPASTWIVGSNGSFLSGVFVDDLVLNSTPSSVIAEPVGVAMLNPGEPLNLTLTSRNVGTAISSAEVVAEVSYPILHQTVTIERPFQRISSTIFAGSIPAMPLGSFVNFTVLSWDFNQRLEVSPEFGYYTPDFTTYDPLLNDNATFFYVLVYDNGTHSWVNGVHVQVIGPGGSFNSVGNTTLGLAYPNQTRNVYIPLLLAAGASYTVTVNDPYFLPGGGPGGPVSVNVLGLHTMTNRQTLAQGSDYTVLQAGNQVVFWLNTTPAPPTQSPSVPGGTVPLAGIVGLVGVGLASVPLVMWFQRIRARRKAEEKRVTL